MPLIDRIEPGPDTIRVLLATDNHVGVYENDPIRGDDAWKTFEEITHLAKQKDVDMIIHGGDLFHINKPSKKSMYHVIKSLRANCMGDRPCELELLSDPAYLANGVEEVNYEDPNLNISIPVFAISGNHDDATGEEFILAIDLLAVTGLINHFGKVRDSEEITVSPVLLQKGTTKLSLYGMSSIRDERLHRLFRDGCVKFQRPALQTEDWFNFLAFHQNRTEHSYISSIPENFLPNFLNFILWGHEHECIPNPQHNTETKFDVLQGGSSVATQLTEGESAPKHVYVMNIKGKDYSIEKIELKTVRPFVMKDIELLKTDLIPGAASRSDVIAYLTEEAEKAIDEANQVYKEKNREFFEGDEDPKLPLPLVRLRVEYSGGFEIENVTRFSNRFVGKVANVNDVVQFYKRKTQPRQSTSLTKKTKFDADLLEEKLNERKANDLKLKDIVSDMLKQTQLALVPEDGINEAVQKTIDNDDKNLLNQFITKEIKRETKALLSIDIDDNDFHGGEEKHRKAAFKQVLLQLRESSVPIDLDAINGESEQDTPKPKAKGGRKKAAPKSKSKEVILDSEDSDIEMFVTEDSIAPSSRRGKSSRSAKLSKPSYEEDFEILSDEDEYVPPKKTSKGGRRR
ncbi:Double-strand break repair protein MRE11 [Candida viswanathii]|uniref:Double-strand break repair protein n=1 Tax=Candida viswanathii TaxID=5486 RepID=A0A367YHF2_9ASCO|nr:Double-strand break repair protein MRE11 [Candida viswanathii]